MSSHGFIADQASSVSGAACLLLDLLLGVNAVGQSVDCWCDTIDVEGLDGSLKSSMFADGVGGGEVRHISRQLTVHTLIASVTIDISIDCSNMVLIGKRCDTLRRVGWRGRNTVRNQAIELLAKRSKSPALVGQLSGAVVASELITILQRQDPVLPPLSSTQTLNIILTNDEVNLVGLLAHAADEGSVGRQLAHALESSDKHKRYETLRVHALTEVHILAKVLNGEVVLDLVAQHANNHVVPIRRLLEGNGSHRRNCIVVRTKLRLNRGDAGRSVGKRHTMVGGTSIAAATSSSWGGCHVHLALSTLPWRRVERSVRPGSLGGERRRVQRCAMLMLSMGVGGMVRSTATEGSTSSLATSFTGGRGVVL